MLMQVYLEQGPMDRRSEELALGNAEISARRSSRAALSRRQRAVRDPLKAAESWPTLNQLPKITWTSRFAYHRPAAIRIDRRRKKGAAV